MTAKNCYRQGDVLIIRAEAPEAESIKAEGPLVLALGESTGHCHQIRNRAAVDLIEEGVRRFLRVRETSLLEHEEHAAVPIPPGEYEVIIQQEYTPQGLRNVAD